MIEYRSMTTKWQRKIKTGEIIIIQLQSERESKTRGRIHASFLAPNDHPVLSFLISRAHWSSNFFISHFSRRMMINFFHLSLLAPNDHPIFVSHFSRRMISHFFLSFLISRVEWSFTSHFSRRMIIHFFYLAYLVPNDHALLSFLIFRAEWSSNSSSDQIQFLHILIVFLCKML